MQLSGQSIPEEIILYIMAQLSDKRPLGPPLGSRTCFDDPHAARLTCKTFARIAAVYLFRTVPFSIHTADWVRITAISKNPALAPCVHRVVYRTSCFYPGHDNIHEYFAYLMSWVRPLETQLSRSPDVRNTFYTLDSLHRGFQVYRAKYEHQKKLLTQHKVLSDASDLRLLVHALKRFPNLKMLSISDYHSGSHKSSVNPPVIVERRCSIMYCGDAGREIVYPRLQDVPSSSKQTAIAKWRGLQLFSLAAERVQIRPLSLALDFDGTPLMTDEEEAAEEGQVDPRTRLPTKQSLVNLCPSKSIWCSLTEFTFHMQCNTERDIGFLQGGALGRAMERAIHLQKIRVWNRYSMTRYRSFMHRREIPIIKKSWMVPLSSVFGNQPFRALRILEIQGVLCTKSDFLDLLSRHKKTLETLRIAGLARFFVDKVRDRYESPNGGDWIECRSILKGIESLGLGLSCLAATPGLSIYGLTSKETREVYGETDIRKFLQSFSGEWDSDESNKGY